MDEITQPPSDTTPTTPPATTEKTEPEKPKRSSLWDVFLPNRVVSSGVMRIVIVFQVALFLIIWLNSPFKVLPRPDEVLRAIPELWMKKGLGQELITSFQLNLQALAISTLISLGLSYLTVLPFFRPIAAAVSKGRFLSMAGFYLLFMLMIGGGHPLKLALLVLGMTVFFLTSMAATVAEIPKEQFDYARTLRMSEWRVVWEVVILGTADKAFEILRQNAAIGWLMLTMVEGLVRSGGGVGVMLISMEKYAKYADLFAIQLVILMVGLIQDYVIGVVRSLVCPYSELTLERKTA